MRRFLVAAGPGRPAPVRAAPTHRRKRNMRLPWVAASLPGPLRGSARLSYHRTPSAATSRSPSVRIRGSPFPERTMPVTSVSLLERLRERPDGDAWQRLEAIYTPLLKQWLTGYGLQASDVDDLTQEVLAVLVRELPRFQHNQRTGAFRRWLRGIAVNRLRELWRNRGDAAHGGGDSDMARRIDQLEDPHSQVS